MSFLPVFIAQLATGSCGGSNCGPASVAMASHRAQRGVRPVGTTAWPPRPADIRRRIDPNGSCGGTSFEENAAAVLALYGVTLTPRYRLPWADYRTLLDAGRGAHTSILYSALRGTRWDSCPTFGGGHAIAVNDVAELGAGVAYPGSPAGTYARVGDPLADGRWLASIGRRALNGWQWWPESVLRDATGQRAGAGLVNASVTIDTEYPASVVIAGSGVNVRQSPAVTAARYGKSTQLADRDHLLGTRAAIRRLADGVNVLPIATRLPLIGWVTGGPWTVGSVTGNVWASVLIDGKPRYIAKALVR